MQLRQATVLLQHCYLALPLTGIDSKRWPRHCAQECHRRPCHIDGNRSVRMDEDRTWHHAQSRLSCIAWQDSTVKTLRHTCFLIPDPKILGCVALLNSRYGGSFSACGYRTRPLTSHVLGCSQDTHNLKTNLRHTLTWVGLQRPCVAMQGAPCLPAAGCQSIAIRLSKAKPPHSNQNTHIQP